MPDVTVAQKVDRDIAGWTQLYIQAGYDRDVDGMTEAAGELVHLHALPVLVAELGEDES